MSDECYFCADDSDVLERHHAVPKRHGGSDDPENLVTVCPTCHRKLERLYGQRFYDQLGVAEEPPDSMEEEVLLRLEAIYWEHLSGPSHLVPQAPDYSTVMADYREQYNPRLDFCKMCQSLTVFVERESRPTCARCGNTVSDADPTRPESALYRRWFDE